VGNGNFYSDQDERYALCVSTDEFYLQLISNGGRAEKCADWVAVVKKINKTRLFSKQTDEYWHKLHFQTRFYL